MSAPAPLLKPRFKTSCQADLFDAFEVEVVTPSLEAKGRFEPRPRMAFDFDDAILALAEMLKAQGATPHDLLMQIGDGGTVQVIQTRLLACDGKHYEHMRLLNKNTHETIWTRLEDFYGGAKAQPTATQAVETAAPVEEGTRYETMATRQPDPVHPADKPKKVLAVRTVYDGSGDRDDRMKDALKGLTADTIPKGGLVITVGKNGPKILKAASAQTDEEQGEEFLEENEAAPVAHFNTGARVQAEAEVTISRDPNPEIPGLSHTRKVAAAPAPEPEHKDDEPVVKKVLETRVMSGDAMDRLKPATKVAKHEAVVFGDDLSEMGMGADEAGALIDAELGGEESDLPGEREMQQMLADPKDTSANLAETMEHGGRRVKKQEGVVRKDRGGTRPTRPVQA
jgi:hypothetical protein